MKLLLVRGEMGEAFSNYLLSIADVLNLFASPRLCGNKNYKPQRRRDTKIFSTSFNLKNTDLNPHPLKGPL